MKNTGTLKVLRIAEDAVLPTKGHNEDVGFDVTAIGVLKTTESGVIMLRTGLQIAPPKGYYIDLIARSSLCKKGYMLANGVGVIDPIYRGEFLIPVVPIGNVIMDLEFPFRAAQLVLRQHCTAQVQEVSNLDNTVRGEGGFGSTG